MWALVDVMEVQRQDVVLGANVHSIMVLIHTKDPVIGCVEQVGEVMSSTGRSQFCVGTEMYSLMAAALTNACSHTHTHN